MKTIYEILYKIKGLILCRKPNPVDPNIHHITGYFMWPDGAIKFTKVMICKNGNDTIQLFEFEDV